jgi:alkanesulfonate monooxygenase SsuD/methylene tetrahydromethanopterin reductase-like flavin-dependent oxidoreductase (luciferase family)
VARGDGWYGFALTPEAAQTCIEGLRHAESESGRGPGLRPLQLSVTPAVPLDRDTARRYEDLGVDRLIPLSMERSPDALVESLEKLAADLLA